MRPGALGDVVLTLPALRALRERFPRAAIDFVAPAPQCEIARWDGLADAALDFGAPDLAPLIGGSARTWPPVLEQPELAILWLRDHAGLGETLGELGVPSLVGAAPLDAIPHRTHVSAWLLRSLATLGVAPALDQPRVLRSPTNPPARDRRYAVVHPGSGSARKNWPGLGPIASRLTGVDVIVTAGPADDEPVRALLDRLPGADVRRDLTLADLAGLLSGATLYLGNDSGVSHLAAALGVPSVVVFGPTDPAIWRPIGRAVTVLGGTTVADGIFAPEPAWPEEGEVLRAAASYVE